MALDVTVGGETSNSYVTVDEADTYFASHYSSAKITTWTALTSAQKDFLLRRACQQIETLRVLDDELSAGTLPVELVISLGYDLTIHRAIINQYLQFPRNLDVDSFDVVYIPTEVKDAQCEQAVFLPSVDDTQMIAAFQGVTEKASTVGPIKTYVKYAPGSIPSYFSPMVAELMRPFFRASGRVQRA